MKQYKLIQAYPGSPEVMTVVCENVKWYYYDNVNPTGIHKDIVENFPYFWEEIKEIKDFDYYNAILEKEGLSLEKEDFTIDSPHLFPDELVYEKDGRQYFSWDISMFTTKMANKKIPTKEQWEKIYELVGLEGINVLLNKNGYRSNTCGAPTLQGSNGYYWSSSPTTINAYDMYFNAGTVNPANTDNRAYGFSVRCLK